MSSKPSAYLSEEARLQAQRRMLAERFGLEMSDNSEDESADDASGTSSDSAPAPEPTPAPAPTRAAISKASDSANGEASKTQRPNATTSTSRTALEALTGRSGVASSSSAPMVSPPLRSPEKSPLPDSPTASGASWPGVILLSDGADGGSAPSSYTYIRNEERVAAGLRRKNRVMPVAMYNSQLLPGHGRKIAVNDGVVTYVVGGHIRGIVRNSSILSLLKGHDATVIDMEFASAHEKRLSEGGAFFSVLGSVGEDGYAYVWRLRRTDASEGATGERGTFDIVDRIPVYHPKQAQGGTYSRISFRPRQGSVVADNGVGVALLLVDPESHDVRAMELVKMDGRVMLRDHTLTAENEVDKDDSVGANVPVRACLWLNVNVTAIARGSAVMLWDFVGKTCIGRLPRGVTSKVTSLHALDDQVLLVAVDDGRVLEIWYIGDGDRRLMQTFTVCAPDSSESFLGVVDVDPGREIIAVANAKGSYILILHYNRTQRRIDALTEVATSQPMLSFTLTRSRKQPLPVSPGPLNEGPEAYTDKIELWYVQPKGIHTMSLNMKHYAPLSKSDGFSTPSSHASSTSLPKTFALDPSIQSKSMVQPPAPSAPTSSSPKPPAVSVVSRSAFDARKSPPTSSPSPPPTEEVTKPAITILQRKPSPPARLSVAAERKAPENKDASPVLSRKPAPEPAKKSPTPTPAPAPVPTPASSPPAPRPEDTEKVAEAMLQAAKRAIEQFEERSRAREDLEYARGDKVVARVRENAEANLERAVNKAMKNCMGNIIIPNVSEVLSRVAPDEKTTGAGARQELYAEIMARSNLLAMYKAGCDEILDQVGGAVERSMQDKCGALVEPAVRTIQAASEDITATVGALVSQLRAASISAAQAPNGTAPEPDIREQVATMLNDGRTDDAFLAVLDRQDLELVTWLLAQFAPHAFFESHVLSQIAALSLAQQVGHRLSAEDSDAFASVEWLRELMLVVDPNDEAIAGAVQDTLNELAAKVTELHKENTLGERHPGIQKQLRQLSLVITSVAADAAS